MKKQYFNPPDRRKRKKITIKTVKAGIMSSVMAAVTAATTVAAPILSYAADLTEVDPSAQTQTITNDDGTQTILRGTRLLIVRKFQVKMKQKRQSFCF